MCGAAPSSRASGASDFMTSFPRWLAALILMLGAPLGMAQTPPSEYQLKAVFLYNFARYVEWPENRLPSGAPIQLCVVGRDPFGATFAPLTGRQVQGREVRVRVLTHGDEGTECHMVFIADSEGRRLGAHLRALAGRAILTVSDIEGFVDAGGCIGFVTVDDRVRFDVNLAAAQGDHLKLSAQLLKVARQVQGARP